MWYHKKESKIKRTPKKQKRMLNYKVENSEIKNDQNSGCM